MAEFVGTFSGRNRYQLQLVYALAWQNSSTRQSGVNWTVQIVETTENGSYTGSGATWAGPGGSGSAPGTTFGYDFRVYNVLVLGSGQVVVQHDGNGNGGIWLAASVGGSSVIGSASAAGAYYPPRIPALAPSAPSLAVPTSPAAGSVSLSWSPPASNGGGGITSYDIQRASDAGMTVGVVNENRPASPTSRTQTGLVAGAVLFYRIRANNSDANGAWSTVQTVQVLSGLYYNDGDSAEPSPAYVNTGLATVAAQVYYNDGDSAEPAA